MFISIFKMSLALLGIVSALNIDNELRVIKIDCYERLAIGERLDPNKVYKSFPYNTVADCKKACSEENSVCKAFSFGISAKGNATCELSVDAIKETADLKPIGTVKNTDFDLYIKKLGCTIVSEPPHRKPPTQSEHNLSNKPDTLGNVKDEVTHHDTPIESVSNPPSTYSLPNPQDEVHKVQALVSIAHGPQTVLDPAHGILVAGNHHNSYSTENDALSNWYNQYDVNNYQPQISYSSFSSSNSYTGINYDLKPHGSTGYPDIDRYDYQPDDNRIYADRYGEKLPPRPYFHSDYNHRRPLPNSYGSVIPHPDQYYKRPTHQDYKPNYYGSEMEYHYNRPSKPFVGKPNHQYDPEYPYNKPYKPEHGVNAAYYYNKPVRPFSERPNNEYGGDYHYSQPSKPFVDRPVHESNYYNPPPKPFNEKPVHENNEKGSKPVSLSLIYEIENPVKDPQTDKLYQGPPKNVNHPPTNDVKYTGYDYTSKPIVTHSTGYKGEQITSIITEIKDKACFRRVLAGKRITRGLVRRALACESVEECQSECAEEKLFVCEGFNYRLDPSGPGKGDCELLSVPLSRIDIFRESYPDPDYDYYERDRNAAALNCRQRQPGQKYGPYHYNDYDDYRHGYRDTNPYAVGDRWANRRYDYEGPRRPPPEPERWPADYFRPSRPVVDRRYDYHSYDFGTAPRPRPASKRRGDYSYLPQTTHFFDRIDDRRYSASPVPPKFPPQPLPFDQKPYDSFSFPHFEYQNTKYHWGIDRYWGVSKYGGGGYLPPDPDLKPPVGLGVKPFEAGVGFEVPADSALLPVEHRRPAYSYIQDECSLRSVTGFKLHKRVVKKYFAVPNIYECEQLCYKERDFPCASYAYRYTITVTEPTDNCYLSNVDYKELDNYTDLEPDRDFDVYTMNNMNRCEVPIAQRSEVSDCFWRVRSGERLHDKIVRDSLKANNIVECQVECLKSKKFTCRAFSYRYGPHIPGGLIDNCQLTDWPYYELNPRIHFIVKPGFEIYERGSFGHGCETGHFAIRGYPEPKPVFNPDQLCYIGFGSPARLLPQAIKKSARVSSETECKEECSKARIETLFQCMSFSFRENSPGASPNCDLSDIYQRDLLPKLDYVYDPRSLLFAWDNYNPDCVVLGDDPLRTNHITSGLYERDDFTNALDTWRVYSVSGWPCKRGAKCQENVEAGFWFCELEGGAHGAWDYCCRPEHQCGASDGYPYLWCYVGPDNTQWRKCSDRYYPYVSDTDRLDDRKHFTPNYYGRPWREPIFRPDRPPAEPPIRPPVPSLDQYEKLFNQQFLEPPVPGGLGQPRHWPVSYLHKEMPPNVTDSKFARMEAEGSKQVRVESAGSKNARTESDDSKYTAIQNLINVIKSNDLKNIQYQISNQSDKKDDVLLVKIPLPSNFTKGAKNLSNGNSTSISLQPISVEEEVSLEAKRLQKSLPPFVDWNTKEPTTVVPDSLISNSTRPSPVYRRAFITRTNVTTHGRHL